MNNRPSKPEMTKQEKEAWNEAIFAVMELLRMHPPSRIGEAAFLRRLSQLKEKV